MELFEKAFPFKDKSFKLSSKTITGLFEEPN